MLGPALAPINTGVDESTRAVTTFFVADTAALSSPVVMLLLIGSAVLLGVRAYLGALHIVLDRIVARLLDASVVIVFLLFVIFVVLRFRIVG